MSWETRKTLLGEAKTGKKLVCGLVGREREEEDPL
jgi:hypothetical protein